MTGAPVVCARIGSARMSETSVLYPKDAPRSVTSTLRLPAPVIFGDDVDHVPRREELALLDVDDLAGRGSGNSRSVCRHRKAGICRISTACATCAHCARHERR